MFFREIKVELTLFRNLREDMLEQLIYRTRRNWQKNSIELKL